MSEENTKVIIQTKIGGTNEKDRCIWKFTPHGNFSTTSAGEAIRKKMIICRGTTGSGIRTCQRKFLFTTGKLGTTALRWMRECNRREFLLLQPMIAVI